MPFLCIRGKQETKSGARNGYSLSSGKKIIARTHAGDSRCGSFEITTCELQPYDARCLRLSSMLGPRLLAGTGALGPYRRCRGRVHSKNWPWTANLSTRPSRARKRAVDATVATLANHRYSNNRTFPPSRPSALCGRCIGPLLPLPIFGSPGPISYLTIAETALTGLEASLWVAHHPLRGDKRLHSSDGRARGERPPWAKEPGLAVGGQAACLGGVSGPLSCRAGLQHRSTRVLAPFAVRSFRRLVRSRRHSILRFQHHGGRRIVHRGRSGA